MGCCAVASVSIRWGCRVLIHPSNLKAVEGQSVTSPATNVPSSTKTCKYGHVREASRRFCLECHRAASLRYSQKNRKEVNARIKRWREVNIEHDTKYHRNYYNANKEECLKVRKRWKEENPERCTEIRREHAKRKPEYSRWVHIIRRADEARIPVCERWRGMGGYERFIQDVGRPPSRDHELTRRDFIKGYDGDNCYWRTRREVRRSRASNQMFTYDGKTQCLTDWADETGISWSTLYNRVVWAKWPLDEAFNKEPHSVDRSAHEALVIAAVKWLEATARCSFSLSEMCSMAMERPDAIGWKATSGMSIVVECKANRLDFFGDAKKPFRSNPKMGMGRLRYYLVPEGLVKPEEVPENWGLLYAGKRIVTIKKPMPFIEWNQQAEASMMISALRRTQLRIKQPLHEWLAWDSELSPIRPVAVADPQAVQADQEKNLQWLLAQRQAAD